MLTTLAGLTFAAAAAVAVRRQPHNPVGALVALAGPALYAEDLGVSWLPYGGLFAVASSAVLLHLALVFPFGRVRTVNERALVLVGYAWAVAVPAWRVACLESSTADRLGRCDVTSSFLDTGNVVVSLVIGWVLIRRTTGAPHEQRGIYVPILGAALAGILPGILLTLPIGTASSRDGIRLAYHAALVLIPLAFLLGVLRASGGLSRLDSLSERLRTAQTPRDIEVILGEALQDNSVRLGTWDHSSRRFTRWDGSRLGGPGFAPVEVTARGELRLGLFRRGDSWVEPRLQSSALRVAALVLAHQGAADEERLRLRRDLHDGAQQTLVAAALKLRMAEDRVRSGEPVDPETLADLRRDLEASLGQLRRIGHGVPATSGADLDAALSAIAERTPVVHLALDSPADLDPLPVQTAYFVAAEAVTNALRHASPTRITVAVSACHQDMWSISVSDDGGGAPGAELRKPGGGLEGLADRVRRVGGRLDVNNGDTGVVVQATLPRRAT